MVSSQKICALVICLLFIQQLGFGQYDKLEDYKIESRIPTTDGLLKVTTTVESAYMFDPQLFNLYIGGTLQYYLEERLSVRVDGFYFLDIRERNSQLLDNHGLFMGGVYHFIKAPIVHPYIGFQPGIQLTRTQYEVPTYVYPQPSYYKITPAASIIGGADFYLSRHFNFFVAGRAVFSDFRGGKVPRPMNLTELRVSLGLGFHIGLKKPPVTLEEN